MAVYDLWWKGTGKNRVKRPAHGKGHRWQARWRDSGDIQRKKNFESQDAAEAYLVRVRDAPEVPKSDRTVAEQYERWIASKAGLRASTIKDYKSKWSNYVEPEFGHRRLVDLEYSELEAWIGRVAGATSATTARRAWLVLRSAIRGAVRDGVIPADRDPSLWVESPVPAKSDVQPYTEEQMYALGRECAPHGLVVFVLGLCGPRFGEMAGFRVRDLDVERGRLRVARSISEVGGILSINLPKNGKVRETPVPPWLMKHLAKLAEGRGPDEPLLTTSNGNLWRHSAWMRIWAGEYRSGKKIKDGARDRCGLPNGRVHDLRHTAATLAIRAGADVKDVQAMLGHESAKMTLDLYGHWFDDRLDDVAKLMGELVPEPPELAPDA